MKTALIRFCKALALLVPLAVMVLFCQEHLFYYRSHNTSRLEGFYREPANTLDVVLIGASDVFCGYSPVYAYEYSGLTSYLYAYASNPGSLALSQLKEILSRQNPQMIVVEINGFLHGETRLRSESNLRQYLEGIPMSMNKLRTIWQYPFKDKLSCLFPFFKYHGQWNLPADQLREQFSNPNRHEGEEPNRLKGTYTWTTLNAEDSAYNVIDDHTSIDLTPIGHAYLTEFLQYCKDQNLHMFFVRFPHKIMSEDQYERFARANRVQEIVQEFGFPFLDLENDVDAVGFDHQYDFFDIEHLSLYGQERLTEYLCDLWLDEYGLVPMEQTDENRQLWDESIAYLHAYTEAASERLENGIDEELYETPEFLRELEERML